MVATLSNKIKTSGYLSISDDENQMWETMAETIRTVYKESWWWNEEVQKKIKDKNRRFKELMACTEVEDRTLKKEMYKEKKRAAKKVVAEAINLVFEDFYQKLDTREGEKYIFKLAKARSRQKKDLGTMKFIKDEGGQVLLRQEDIKLRWHQYFAQLLNEISGLKEEI
ncbi:uncharacterized protein LOC130805539 [Amaranthus tricolor]|uniref:uncharacterized protein LOC130805539 n=1 Tax=Amaranthus tricolor TaxID=29722 RepID=UPI00258F04E7|nr:uncharacterized protein LOC130805539 [Amaranthus tricolor]